MNQTALDGCHFSQTREQRTEVEAVMESFMEKLGEALHLGDRVDLRGFGSFVVKQRKARQGRSPRTGEAISIAAKRSVMFKPATLFQEQNGLFGGDKNRDDTEREG